MDHESKVKRFERLIMPHLDTAHAFARWLTRNESDAEDVVQTACLRAFTYFDKFDGANPSAWMLAIVRNTYLTWMKQNHPREETAETSATDDQYASSSAALLNQSDFVKDPEARLVEDRERARLNELVAQLPPLFREVIVLREIADMSYREIADIIGIPIGTVMSRLSRARRLLRSAWSDPR